MRIANFDATGLDEAERFVQMTKAVSKETLADMLQSCNVAFVAEEINRLQSMLLCELKDSYVQQSQRYVTIGEEGYTLPELDELDTQTARQMMQEALKLYQEMSELKEQVPGRPKPENYRYGIPIEDARYVLPLAVKTNISVAMSGDKLLQLFKLLKDVRYQPIFVAMYEALLALLPPQLGRILDEMDFEYSDIAQLEDFYRPQLKALDAEPVQLLASFDSMIVKAGLGALTSTSGKTPSQVLAGWREEAETKAYHVVKRVMGYGHSSVIEQSRATFGLRFSLVTYHQQERHRLSSNYREDLENIIEENRTIIIPPTISSSIFKERFIQMTERFRKFRRQLKNKYHNGAHLYFLLNCDPVKVIMGANARTENTMLSERICNNAQWEIRQVAVRKLELLRGLSEVLYKDALPPCVYGTCREGKLSCGQAEAMRRQYRLSDE